MCGGPVRYVVCQWREVPINSVLNSFFNSCPLFKPKGQTWPLSRIPGTRRWPWLLPSDTRRVSMVFLWVFAYRKRLLLNPRVHLFCALVQKVLEDHILKLYKPPTWHWLPAGGERNDLQLIYVHAHGDTQPGETYFKKLFIPFVVFPFFVLQCTEAF